MTQSISQTVEELDLGQRLAALLATYVHEEIELVSWYLGRENLYGSGPIEIYPDDLTTIVRYILKNYRRVI